MSKERIFFSIEQGPSNAMLGSWIGTCLVFFIHIQFSTMWKLKTGYNNQFRNYNSEFSQSFWTNQNKCYKSCFLCLCFVIFNLIGSKKFNPDSYFRNWFLDPVSQVCASKSFLPWTDFLPWEILSTKIPLKKK